MNISCGRPKQWYDRCPIGVVLPTNWVTVPNRYSSPNHSGGTLSRWVGYLLPTIWKPRVVSLKFWGYLNSVIPSVQHCKRGNVHLVPCYSHTMHVFWITCLIKPTWSLINTTYLKISGYIRIYSYSLRNCLCNISIQLHRDWKVWDFGIEVFLSFI